MRAAIGGVDPRPAPADGGGDVGRWRVDTPTHQAIEAIRRILDADGVDLLKLDRSTGAIGIAVRGEGDGVQLSRVVREAVAAQCDFMLADHQPRWIAGWPNPGGATVLARIVEREAHSYFMAARVANGPEARERAMRLVPDLVRLVLLHVDAGAQWRGLIEEHNAAVQALDHGECGVIVIRADHSIVLTNAAARAVLLAEAGLHIRRGTVHPTGYADAIRFHEAVDRVIDPPSNERSSPPRAIVMLLSGGSESRPPVLVIAPAERRTRNGAAAVIYIVQPATGAQRGLETLCRIHGLSKVETRLMTHLAAGMAVAEAAAEIGVKVETARSYLKQIFGKVGVHRQADLMGLMARYQRALRGDFDFQAA